MRPRIGTISMLAAVILFGCATVQVSQDYDSDMDLSRYHTWQWRHPVQEPTGDARVDNPLQDKRIRRAVADYLAGLNLVAVGEHPDLYLVYHLGIDRSIRGGYHSTAGVGGYYHPWYGDIGADMPVSQYDQNRLIIDIYAADTGNLLWRGMGVYLYRTYETPEKADAATQRIVDDVLAQFPPRGRN